MGLGYTPSKDTCATVIRQSLAYVDPYSAIHVVLGNI